MSGTIRSFIALDIGNETVIKRLSEIQGMLMNTGADLKLVRPENIHVTVRFLGNIVTSMVDLIHEEMKKIYFTPFEIELKGLGAFPKLRYARVVWAGIQGGADELVNIFNQLEPRLRRLGFKPDSKGFSPHLTIARVRTRRQKARLIRCLEDLADYKFGLIEADCLRLKKSVLTPKGPIYTTLREVYSS